jgi:hypothetical protein
MEQELIGYQEICRRRTSDTLRHQEVPDTHAVTLPLPTLRLKEPGFAQMAAPALRRPGSPQVQGPPDRWWVVSAENAKLLLYARCGVLPFASVEEFTKQELVAPAGTIEELKARQQELSAQLDALSPAFFHGHLAPKPERAHLLDVFRSFISPGLYTQYRALVPDFFSWLEA